jgi:4-amino-4-deoxy-L-arabinose transferase-like glycosyltransferase
MLDSLNKSKIKNSWWVVLIILLFSVGWFFLFFNFSTLWAQDSFWYARLAENLATGKGYTLEGEYPHAQYPIGLPLLVAPLFFFTGNAPVAGLIVVFILSLASIVLAYLIGREFNPLVGIISAILLASHNLFIFNSMSVMTETPFMFFSVLGLYLFMKSYEQRTLVIPSAICITFSILIRYDGFFLAVPMLFYLVYRRKDFEKFFFSKKTFTAIGIGILILSAWFIRNIIAFGKPLMNAHSAGDGSLGLSLFNILEFFSYFRYTGYLFPILSIIGIFFIIFKIKDAKLNTFLIWIFVYLVFHAWWWARAFRFYGEILILFCIFTAIASKEIYNLFPKKQKKLGILIVGSIIFLIVLEQIFIFSSGSINHESTIDTLNRYNPIKEACEYANQNLPEDAVYVYPEQIVYSEFLRKENSLDYNNGLNYLFSTKGEIYFFTDNLHPWITNSFIPKNGRILLNVPTQQGINVQVALYPVMVENFEKKAGKDTFNATIWKIDNFEVIN